MDYESQYIAIVLHYVDICVNIIFRKNYILNNSNICLKTILVLELSFTFLFISSDRLYSVELLISAMQLRNQKLLGKILINAKMQRKLVP